jgi:hypothetical protein
VVDYFRNQGVNDMPCGILVAYGVPGLTKRVVDPVSVSVILGKTDLGPEKLRIPCSKPGSSFQVPWGEEDNMDVPLSLRLTHRESSYPKKVQHRA